MKTVFNRVLSLIMCLILICSTVSVMAFGADAAEDFDYKTYAQNATKENVHHLLDLVDGALADANGAENKLRMEVELLKDIPSLLMTFVNGIIERFIDKSAIRLVNKGGIFGTTDLYLSLDLSSVDAICKTLDNYRGVIELATNEDINEMLDLGNLGDINLDVFDEGLSRAKSGDYKIFTEVLELANANGNTIEAFLSGNLKLGVIGDALPKEALDGIRNIKVGNIVKEGIVNALFEGKPNYEEAKSRALTNFDEFVYTDIMGLLSAQGGILEGVTINESTTIDDLITNIFDIIIDKYLVDMVSGLSFKFADIDAKYTKLDTVLQLDGQYDFSEIGFKKGESVLAQINDVLGKAFVQIVPSYETYWVYGKDYELIGNNVREIVKYVAEESGVIETEGKSDEQLMLEIFKLVAEGTDPNGAYLAVKDTKNLTDMASKILIYLSGKSYPANATYEHVLGDYVIGLLEDFVPLIDEKGKTIVADGKKTLWEVFNSVFNFYFVEKNLDAFFGWNFTKEQTYFEKLDIMLDYTADDGTADFSSKTYFDDLFESIFTVDLKRFIELTAAKALGKGRNSFSVVTFLYNTAYNMFNNWTESSVKLDKYETNPFNNALSDDGIANIVRVVLETLNKRSDATATFMGLFAHNITSISEKVELKDATCTAAGYRTTKTCLKCNKVYLKGATIAAKGHKYNSGVITKAPKCEVKGEKTFTCTVCGHKRVDPVAKTGHKESGYKVTKAATYKTKGQKVNTCTVCKTTLGTQITNMLTLKKATGLKFQALSTTSIKFSWNAVAGAESYTFYYKTNTGKWKKVNAKNKTTVTVKKLKAGTTYKFKVEAIAGGNKSESSTVSATTKPAAVTIKALRSSKKKEIVVEWKKVAGVTGYEVQYSTSKKFAKKSTKTVTIKKQKTVKTIIKKLKSKKKYYARVRAYKTVNGVKVYGAYSKVKNIKCK